MAVNGRKGHDEQVDIQTMGHLFAVGMQSMNGGMGTRHEQKPTAEFYSECTNEHLTIST